MNEIDFQTLIINSIKNEGGYGRKLSHRFLVGIPDLLLKLAPYGTRSLLVLAEVKLLRVSEKYDLRREPKIGITPRQTQELIKFENSCIIVGVQRNNVLSSVHVIRSSYDIFPYFAMGNLAVVDKGRITPSLTTMIMETIYG